jgi:hypothetical protein
MFKKNDDLEIIELIGLPPTDDARTDINHA